MSSWYQKLRDVWEANQPATQLRKEFGQSEVSASVVARLRAERSATLVLMLRAAAIIGSATDLLLLADFRMSKLPFYCVLIDFVLLAIYADTFYRGYRWLRTENLDMTAAWFVNSVRLRLLALGVFWAVLVDTLMDHANPHQQGLIYAICIGLISSSALITPLSAAFAFWLPVTFGAILAVPLASAGFDIFELMCLATYSILIGFCIVFLNAEFIKRTQSMALLEESNEVVRLLLRDFEENASDWLWETNSALELQRVSPRLMEVSRKTREELAGVFPQVLLGDIAKFDQRAGSPVARLTRYLNERSAFRDLVVPVVIAGEERTWSLTGKPILDRAGRFVGYHGVGSDITMAKRSQEQIAFLARHDSLTRLPNRVLFNEVLHQVCLRSAQEPAALLCLDLDDFKLVNDTLGHATGDAVLVAVGERIRGCIRDGDTAARLGGDEFAIILASSDVEEVAVVARRLVERISRPYHFDGRLVEIGISIGASLAPKDAKTPAGLLKNADLALYRAKSDGRGVWRFYDPQMDERLQDRRSLQSDLRQALLNDELLLDFQPIIDLATNRMVSAEALLRWQHPERGLLSPAVFVPLAEEAGMISAIGAWVLRHACEVAASWPDHVCIAVNLSPLQFRDAGLVASVAAILNETGLPPSRLELEITETTVLETNSQTVDALWQLHGMGVRIALDDFGTGYSSLSYLRRFPFNKIKIDRSFIRDLGHEKDDSSITLAIIGLACSMNMLVTAEGVETEEQAAMLTSFGCTQAQGYLFCRPVGAEHIPAMIMADHQLSNQPYPSAAQ
jgi:diguanylate cyclase (GGDEF)-like protein